MKSQNLVTGPDGWMRNFVESFAADGTARRRRDSLTQPSVVQCAPGASSMEWATNLGSTLRPDESRSESLDASRAVARIEPASYGRTFVVGSYRHRTIVRILDFNQGSTSEPYFEPSTHLLPDMSDSAPVRSDPHPEDGSEIELFSRSPSTGRADVDARLLVWHVRNVDAAIELARRVISVPVADRLTDLWRQPRDASADEQPLNLSSVQWFLDYIVRRGKNERSLMGMTPDGMIECQWRRERDQQLTIRFFGDGTVWIAIRDHNTRGSWEMLARELLTEQSVVRIPDWA